VKSLRWHPAIWVGAWFALLIAVWATRPLLPIDETRYASVAWEMWLRRSFLVPYVNDVPYSDKPPLLFWLILLGWRVIGVREWWVRLVPPLLALGSLFLLARLARSLWPDREWPAVGAPWVLLGTIIWSVYGTLVLFDPLIAFFTLLAFLGMLRVSRQGGVGGWLLVGLAIGLGILSKGPVVLVYVGPPALLGPWWGGAGIGSWRRWYAGLAAAVVLGAAIALAWALPAARAGGPEYASRILWYQTAGRLSGSFAHARPFWWYLALLPLLLFPWSVTPAVWRGIARLARAPRDAGVRFCLSSLIPGLVLFSLISGKQLHYMLPLFPAFALLVARGLEYDGTAGRRRDLLPAALGLMVVALLMIALPHLRELTPRLGHDLPPQASQVSPLWGASLLVAGVALVAVRWRGLWVPALSLASLVWLVVLHLGVMRVVAPEYDARPAALRIHGWQEQGRPIANAGRYHSEFEFLGRLEQPVQQIELEQARAWMLAHPGGKMVAYHKEWPLDVPVAPDFTQRYRGRVLAVWGERAVLEAPAWPPQPCSAAGEGEANQSCPGWIAPGAGGD
jgi:4-amino-4-deoxy-L-arabinose transferase-like glycosyltransferase